MRNFLSNFRNILKETVKQILIKFLEELRKNSKIFEELLGNIIILERLFKKFSNNFRRIYSSPSSLTAE